MALLLPLTQTQTAWGKTVPNDEAGQAEADRKLIPSDKSQFRFGILGSFEFKTTIRHQYRIDLQGVLRRSKLEQRLYRACGAGGDQCPSGLRNWRRLIGDLRGRPPLEQLASLNRFVNRAVSYKDDSEAFGKRDHWATPIEFFTSGGDCEDYALLKFLSLLELGFDNDRLRIAIVKDTRRRLLHAVVTVQIGKKTYVLDNLHDQPVTHEYILKYVPVFSANLDTQWAHIVTKQIRTAFVSHVVQERQAQRAKPRVSTVAQHDQNGRSESPNGQVDGQKSSKTSDAAVVVDWT